MYLVHEKKDRTGKWEVAWMWLPHFLASDKNLHKFVGQKMTESFKGQTVEDDPAQRNQLLLQMHQEVIHLILSQYPIPGLRQYLESTIHLDPEEEPES
jgi:hypothetical protein